LAKVRTTWGKASNRLRQRANKCNKNHVGRLPTWESDVFRHGSRIGKSYCRTRSDVGSEWVKGFMWSLALSAFDRKHIIWGPVQSKIFFSKRQTEKWGLPYQ
jgi:hypothetical protein